MNYVGKEKEVAKAIDLAGFPPHARKRLGKAYPAVLDALVELYRNDHGNNFYALVYDAERTKDDRLLSDLGARLLPYGPMAAYKLGKKADNSELTLQAEEAMLGGNLRQAHSDVQEDKELSERIFDRAIELHDIEAAVDIAYQNRDYTRRRLRKIGFRLLQLAPAQAYRVVKDIVSDPHSDHDYFSGLLTKARQQFAQKNPLEAFTYQHEDPELAKLAVDVSIEGIKSYAFYDFVKKRMPKRDDLLKEARIRYAQTKPDLACHVGSTERDLELVNLAIQSGKVEPGTLLYARRKLGKPKLLEKAAPKISELSGLSTKEAKALFA